MIVTQPEDSPTWRGGGEVGGFEDACSHQPQGLLLGHRLSLVHEGDEGGGKEGQHEHYLPVMEDKPIQLDIIAAYILLIDISLPSFSEWLL